MPLTLRQICLVAKDLEPAIDDLTSVLGIEACYADPDVVVFGLKNTLLAVGTNFIEVVSPIEEGTAAGRYLKRRNGDGGYMIITQTDGRETQEACRIRAASMDIRVAWELPHDTGRYMQLHPADTGGSFFEIDWDETSLKSIGMKTTIPWATGLRQAEAAGRNSLRRMLYRPLLPPSFSLPIQSPWPGDGAPSPTFPSGGIWKTDPS